MDIIRSKFKKRKTVESYLTLIHPCVDFDLKFYLGEPPRTGKNSISLRFNHLIYNTVIDGDGPGF